MGGKNEPKAGADTARTAAGAKRDSYAAPRTDEIDHIEPLSGVDRSGLGEKGWAEVPEDCIGGHPELDTITKPGAGGLNGPQPDVDPKTGIPR